MYATKFLNYYFIRAINGFVQAHEKSESDKCALIQGKLPGFVDGILEVIPGCKSSVLTLVLECLTTIITVNIFFMTLNESTGI